MHILITGAFPLNEAFQKELESFGCIVHFQQFEKDPVDCPERYDAIICNGLFLHHDISLFTKLQYIQLTSAGYDRVPLDYIHEHNISLYNAHGVYSIPMAEFALCGVLQLYKQSHFFHTNQQKHIWNKHRGLRDVCGKTVAILGCGSVGQACAMRFKAMGCTVFGINEIAVDSSYFDEIHEIAKLNKVLADADIVIIALPLTKETKGLFDEQRLSAMKADAVLVNIARGGIVKNDALISVLNSGHLFGAVLDVFESEPLEEDSPLWDMQNVIVTPHNSFVSEGNTERLRDVANRNLREFMGEYTHA